MGKIKWILYLLILVNSLNCKNRIYEEDAEHINGLLYALKENTPYTGILLDTFSNGQISAKFLYKDGKPSGKWKTLDHYGDIVQQGIYFRDEEIETYLFQYPFIKSATLCSFHEGDYSFLILYIDTSKKIEEAQKISNYIYQNYFIKYDSDEYEVAFYNNDSLLLKY